MVEGTGLENRQARKRLEGSNPSPSAKFRWQHFDIYRRFVLPVEAVPKFVPKAAQVLR